MNYNETLRPVVAIFLDDHLSETSIQDLLYGLEEEGIPYGVTKRKIQNIHEAAYQAAVSSSLEVGIGCTQEEVVLHHKNLTVERPYLSLERYQTLPREVVKNFGANGARLIKGLPLKEIT